MNNFYIYVLILFNLICGSAVINADFLQNRPTELWSAEFQNELMAKVGAALPKLVTYPFFLYPNKEHSTVLDRFPEGKVLVFGYGSLMNMASAGRSVKPEAVASMMPVVAFGVKRVFNYKAKKTDHWGANQHHKEKAMLNLVQTFNISSMANGVVVEVDADDLANLVSRETGYDLVPILVVDWEKVMAQDSAIEMVIAYTFVATNELRNHLGYTSTEFYPVRGYLHAVQEAAETFGSDFADMWDATTFLADGTTTIREWDQITFIGILCTFPD